MEIFGIILSGIIGTTLMTVITKWVNQREYPAANLIEIIGSLWTRNKKDAFRVGLVLHYWAGIAFAFIYSLLLSFAPVRSTIGAVCLTTAVGFVHGLTVGLMMMVLVSEHHPDARFRRGGWEVLASHTAGHVFYGFWLGLTLSFTRSTLIGSSAVDLIGYLSALAVLVGLPLLAALVLPAFYKALGRSENPTKHTSRASKKAAGQIPHKELKIRRAL